MGPLTFECVRECARGRWHAILAGLGIAPAVLRNRHGPCPGCGGQATRASDQQKKSRQGGTPYREFELHTEEV